MYYEFTSVQFCFTDNRTKVELKCQKRFLYPVHDIFILFGTVHCELGKSRHKNHQSVMPVRARGSSPTMMQFIKRDYEFADNAQIRNRRLIGIAIQVRYNLCHRAMHRRQPQEAILRYVLMLYYIDVLFVLMSLFYELDR